MDKEKNNELLWKTDEMIKNAESINKSLKELKKEYNIMPIETKKEILDLYEAYSSSINNLKWKLIDLK